MSTVLFVANRGFALTSSRLGIFESLLNAGYEVVACIGFDGHEEKLRDLGVRIENIKVDRGGPSFFKDFQLFLRLLKLYRKWRPDIIHNFHAKPIVFGAFASAFSPKSKLVNNFEGLGFPFVSRGIAYKMSSLAFRLALLRSSQNVFLNQDDLDLFVSNGITPKYKATLVFSPGVDVQKFCSSTDERSGEKVFVMAGRLLWSKGVREFCYAAREVKKRYPETRFLIAGEWDLTHKDSVDKETFNNLVSECGVEFLGYVSDMPALLKKAYCFVLPTKYREGVPRVVLEAQSSGVPVITTNVPGCRHAVLDGSTGYIVNPGDYDSLSSAMIKICDSEELRSNLSKNAIARAKSQFDTRIVTEKQLNVYRNLGFKV